MDKRVFSEIVKGSESPTGTEQDAKSLRPGKWSSTTLTENQFGWLDRVTRKYNKVIQLNGKS